MQRKRGTQPPMCGLEAAPRVLSALENLVGNSRHLSGDALSLADIHLAPMIGYFQLASEGKSILQRYAIN